MLARSDELPPESAQLSARKDYRLRRQLSRFWEVHQTERASLVASSSLSRQAVRPTRDLFTAFSAKNPEPTVRQNEKMCLTQLTNLIVDHQDHVVASLLGMHYDISASHAQAIFSSSRQQWLPPVTNNIVEKEIIKFAAASESHRADILQSSTGFGLLLFSCACNDTNPVHEVEFDRLDRFSDIAVLNVASSPSGLKKAIDQMERNLNILHGAVNATQTSSEEDSQLHVMKNEEGRRFHPRTRH